MCLDFDPTLSYLNRRTYACATPPSLGLEPFDLTPRETEIYLLQTANYSETEIADVLQISLNTVKKHLKRIAAQKNRLQPDADERLRASLNTVKPTKSVRSEWLFQMPTPFATDPLLPKPGEIWAVNRSIKSPVECSATDQQSIYPDAVQQFLAGDSSPRYVMVVREPEPVITRKIDQKAEAAQVWQLRQQGQSLEQIAAALNIPQERVKQHISDSRFERQRTAQDWLMVTVMPLTLKTHYLSPVDVLLPTDLSQIGHDVLAETWNLQPMLVCNLSHSVGRRLSRAVYDLLLSIGDAHHDRTYLPPAPDAIAAAGLSVGTPDAEQLAAIEAFHQREDDWCELLRWPIAACRASLKALKFTELLVSEALEAEREWLEFSNPATETPSPLSSTTAAFNQVATVLSQWFHQSFQTDWQAITDEFTSPVYGLWEARSPQLPFAFRSAASVVVPDSDEVETLVHQLTTAPGSADIRYAAKRLADAINPPLEAIAALVQVVQTTSDDEVLWAVVEALWRLAPDHPVGGVRRIKWIDRELPQPVALAVALVQKVGQRVGILLRVCSTGEQPHLPAGLKLTLLDETGSTLREVVARQSDLYIQLKLSGQPGERFSVSVAIANFSITEEFVI